MDYENIVQYNLYAYCFNNPINMFDDGGYWPTWLKKAVAVVAVAAVVITATVVTVSTFGAGSVAGVAAISATANMVVKTAEVATLQIKKGINDGKNASQIAKDCAESIYDNGRQIIGLTPATKAVGIGTQHILNKKVAEVFDEKVSLTETLRGTAKGILAYSFVAYNGAQAVISALASDPVERAKQRGYILK